MNLPFYAPSAIPLVATAAVDTGVQLRNIVKGICPKRFLERLQRKKVPLPLSAKQYLHYTVREFLKAARLLNIPLYKYQGVRYCFNGAHYSALEDEALQSALVTAAMLLGMQPADADHYQFRHHLLKQFTAKVPIRKGYPEGAVMINLQNGIYAVTSSGGGLLPHSGEHFITYQLPFLYAPSAEAPLFEAYLSQVQPSREVQELLAEYIAYTFTRELKLEKVLLLYGSGANGKSVFYDIVRALLGAENISHFSLQNLTSASGYYRALLGTKLLNYSSELSRQMDAAVFKQLASGEPVEARLPYGTPQLIRNYAKLMYNCNVLPQGIEESDGFFRRFLVVPFDVTIPEAAQDKELAQKIIQSELSGVFNWVLRGLQRLLLQKAFTHCAAVEQTVKEYRAQADIVQTFLHEERIIPTASNEHNYLSSLYRMYLKFCLEEGFKPHKRIAFKRSLMAKGYLIVRRNQGEVVFYEREDLRYCPTLHATPREEATSPANTAHAARVKSEKSATPTPPFKTQLR
jgi:putative DNA primase/helicase